jgi:hypothetical protein
MKNDSTEELLLQEPAVDAIFSKLQLPHPGRDYSVWHLLTVLEDLLRFSFSGAISHRLVDAALNGDESKYALRHCLDEIFRRCDSHYGMGSPKRTVPQVYVRAFDFYKAGCDLASASKIFGSLRAGRSIVNKSNDEYHIEYPIESDARYAALEVLNHGRELAADVMGQLYAWLHDETSIPPNFELIFSRSKLKGKRISYEYGPQASVLAGELAQRIEIIPRDWVFPWGSAFENLVLINSLLIRCVYHILTINLVSSRLRLTGGGDSSLVLVVSKSELCRDLSLFADFDANKISTFIDYLTYGFGTRTPDPALQPLIPMVSGQLMIPCFHVVTCDHQRNMLSLMARVDSAGFDRQSDLFEAGMIDGLREYLEKFAHGCINAKIKINGGEQEFDVLLADVPSKILLILELRWILQPGDPREISNKMGECIKKVKKLDVKITYCEKYLPKIVSTLIPSVGSVSFEGWRVFGAVVIEGYGGVFSGRTELPIITSEVLKIGLSEIGDLERLIEWMQSLVWLPQRDVHFKDDLGEEVIGGNRVSFPAFQLLDGASGYREYVSDTAKSVAHTRSTA